MDREPERPEPLSTLLVRLLQQAGALLDARLRLTRAEARAWLRDLAAAAVLLAIALALLLLMVPVAVAVLILVLAEVLPPWLATAVVLAAMAVVIVVLAAVARGRLRRRRPTLLQDLREDWRAIRRMLERRP
ncbi:MAG: phage holin family protein [Armatimonadota bacterium]|nr:phage holin family protein [Armatimonadota bacterium]MDR7404238.1 phage holin family protein [Armatimonadota bacterium]